LAPIEPGDERWPARKEQLLARVHARGQALHHRQQLVRGLAVAVVLALGAGVPAVLATASGGGGQKRLHAVAAPPTSTTEEVTTTTGPTTTTTTTTAPKPAAAPTTVPRATTTTTSPPVTSAQACGDATPDNQPLCLSVDYAPASPKVGEEVVFHLVATDGDRLISGTGCGTFHTFGDENSFGGCAPECAAPTSTTLPPAKEPGRYETDFRHAYAKPGVYTAHFEMQSGLDCDSNPYDSSASVSLTVRVSG